MEILSEANAEQIAKLTKALEENTNSLQAFVDLGKHIKFTLSFLGYLEHVAVWVAKIAAACAILWASWKFAVKEAISHVIK